MTFHAPSSPRAGLDAHVLQVFDRAVATLTAAGAVVTVKEVPVMDEAHALYEGVDHALNQPQHVSCPHLTRPDLA